MKDFACRWATVESSLGQGTDAEKVALATLDRQLYLRLSETACLTPAY